VSAPSTPPRCCARYPWRLLVFNDVAEATDITLDKGGTSGFDAPNSDAPKWTYSNPVNPSPGFDWTDAHKTIDIHTPAKPAPQPLRSYIIAPDYSRAIPLEAVEFHREDGRVVWSEGECPEGVEPLSPIQLESLKNLKVKPCS
jgi:hypothetical protein